VGWAGLGSGIIGILLTVAGLFSQSLALGLIGLALLVIAAVGFFALYHQQRRLRDAESKVDELQRDWVKPHITLLDISTEVRFHDKDTHRANQVEIRKAHVNYPGITEFWFRGIDADGETENLFIDDRVPDDRRTLAGPIEVGKRFPQELQRDKPFTIKLSFDMIDAFQGKSEYLIHQARSLSGSMRVKVHFHPEKPYTSARVYVHPSHQRERPLDEEREVTVTRSNDGSELEYVVSSPEPGADYRLEWNW